ncbi:uncharacterized protein LOC108049823 [Drosophila rhopaloa]|uniref:Uncharacterized protein LOC108049823 n=1 Tax=Drosophila rhopaloa TaxID=1041015 RepID=A0A6P4F8S8_DRORH|nr:uncharacterized protein LOC108049823 [Drosophila rhopaloa]
MGKKFCYSEQKAATQAKPRIANRKSYRQGNRDQLEKDPDAEEEKKEDEGDEDMENPEQPQQVNGGVVGNLANGYLKLVDQIQARLCPPPPPVVEVQVEEKREVGGEIPENPLVEEEISESSEDTTRPCIGFVDLFRRSLHFECLGIPLTPLELFSMECRRREELKGRFASGSEDRNPSKISQKELKKPKEDLSNTAIPILRRVSPPPETRNPVKNNMETPQHKSDPEGILEDGNKSLNCSSIELAKYSPKFQSRFYGKYPNQNMAKKLVKRCSSQNLQKFPEPFFKSALDSFRLPGKDPIQNPIVKTTSRASVKFPEQTQARYSIPSRRCAKFPVQSPSKILGKLKLPSKRQSGDPFHSNQSAKKKPVDCKKNRDMEPSGSIKSPILIKQNEESKKNVTINRRNLSKASLSPRWIPCRRESKLHRSISRNDCRTNESPRLKRPKTLTLKTLLSPRPLKDCHSSGSEGFKNRSQLIGFKGAKTPDPVKSSSLENFDERLKTLLRSEPKKSCLKKSDDAERLVPLHSTDTFAEVWRKTGLGNGYRDEKLRMGGLYSRGAKLKFQPIDRLDAGCAGTPLFRESDETLERTQYFVTEFDKLSRAERVQDLELRMGQLRLLQSTSDREYRRHFREQKNIFRPVLTNSVKFGCPLNHDDCPAVMNATLLSHFVNQHLNEPGIELREIFESERMLIIFSPRAFQLGKNTCMSVIVYGGVRNKPCTLPAARFMPTQNVQLPEPYVRYSGHLPLFVMICRNRLSSLEGRKVRFEGVDDKDAVALWMASMDLPQPIHVVMTVLNRRLDITRSSIMKVRGIHKSHDCQEFMPSSKQYMRLSDQDLRVLTNDHTEPLYMEITVKEYAGIFPCRHSLPSKGVN